ncbi:MAG: hypothetical protein COA91_05035 [Robiginitomaculum sp.]|nr:MAG: hypothetical protein COA91_05035 [Robiginitomaculum sp.]
MLKKIFVITITALTALLVFMLFALPASEKADVKFSENSFGVENIRIFDGEIILENYSLIVKDGVISQMGEDLKIPKNMQAYDGKGKTLLPGFIDSHTHIFGPALKDSLLFAVTTNFDMFTSAQTLTGMKTKRSGILETDESDLWSAGIMATAPGGHGTQYGIDIETLTRPEQASAWVTRRLAEGSDYIKLVYMPDRPNLASLDLETSSALIKAGHEQGVLVLAHISTLAAAQDMLNADVDGLVHIFADKPVTEEFAAQAAKDNVFIIPTLAVMASVAGENLGADILANQLATPYLTSAQKQGLATGFGRAWPGFDIDIALENTRKLHAAGVVILAGSDAPNPGTTHGASLHQEMALLVRAGLTPLEALHAATSATAAAFGIKDRGRIEVGMRADLIIVSGRPDENIAHSFTIDKIVKNGYVVQREKQKPIDAQASPELADPILGNFDKDINPSENLTTQGFAWSATDDRMANGKSEAKISHANLGADETGGALRVNAQVKSGFFFPWAGAYFGHPAQKAHNIAAYNTLSFQVRGTPGMYTAMIFTSGSVGAPPSQNFNITSDITSDWQTITLNMENFNGLNPKLFAGLAITAGPAPGVFDYEIDTVTLGK